MTASHAIFCQACGRLICNELIIIGLRCVFLQASQTETWEFAKLKRCIASGKASDAKTFRFAPSRHSLRSCHPFTRPRAATGLSRQKPFPPALQLCVMPALPTGLFEGRWEHLWGYNASNGPFSAPLGAPHPRIEVIPREARYRWIRRWLLRRRCLRGPCGWRRSQRASASGARRER